MGGARTTVQAPVPPQRLVIVGHPIAHSLSPVFQNAALRALGRAPTYEAVDVAPDALDEVFRQFAHDAVAGNVTIPHKESVAALARCTPLAQRVGAVNTFWHDGGELIGHNTDVAGVAATVHALVPNGVSRARCTIFGAGGSAAAALVALQDAGCDDMVIVARNRTRAEQLAERLRIKVTITDDVVSGVEDSALVINATPVGLRDDHMVISPDHLPPSSAAFDLVYRRDVTPWIRACRAAGHRAEDGLMMLLEQGAAAFACWFGNPVPRRAMWESLGCVWPSTSAVEER